MAYRIIYDPSVTGCISVDNNTGNALPYAQGQLYPVWNTAAGTLSLEYQAQDRFHALDITAYGSLSLSSDGGSTFTTPSTFAALITWVKDYLFIQGGGSGGGGSITSPIGQLAMAASVSVAIATDQSSVPVSIQQPKGQNTKANSLPVTLASDQPLITTGGMTSIVAVAPTINAGTYNSNYQIGQVLNFTGAVRVNNGTATLDSITIVDYSNQKQPLDLYFFSQNPANGTYGSNTTVNPNATDWTYLIRKQSILSTDWESIGVGSGQFATADILIHKTVVNTESNTKIYMMVVSQGAPVYTQPNPLYIKASFYQD